MNNIIQCSTLGYNGRFGNQLFQYAFAKSYAEKYNCRLQIPENWHGRKIFPNIVDESLDRKLPINYEGDINLFENQKTNIDLDGYYTTRFHTKIMDSDKIKKWFSFSEQCFLPNMVPNFQYTAVHLRRTDFIETISKECIEHWIKFYSCDNLPIIIVSDDQNMASKKENFGITNYNSDLQDFFILMNATNIFRTNSTFSWWASELSTKKQKTYSPIVFNKLKIGQKNQFVDYKEGNYHVLAHGPFIDSFKEQEIYEIYFGDNKK